MKSGHLTLHDQIIPVQEYTGETHFIVYFIFTAQKFTKSKTQIKFHPSSLLSILFNNNLLEVVREEEKGVQHAFNIKMGKYSDRCEAEGILFSWRL